MAKVCGVDGQCLLEALQGQAGVAEPPERDPQIVVGHLVVGVLFNIPSECLRCRPILLLSEEFFTVELFASVEDICPGGLLFRRQGAGRLLVARQFLGWVFRL